MVKLAIDTASIRASIATHKAQYCDNLDLLPSMIPNVHTLMAICVVLGPGPFTALRVGLSFAQGLAMALNIPIYGCTSFELYRYIAKTEYGISDPLVALDSKRKGYVYLEKSNLKADIYPVTMLKDQDIIGTFQPTLSLNKPAAEYLLTMDLKEVITPEAVYVYDPEYNKMENIC